MKTIFIALAVALSLVGCKSTGELRAERAEAKQTQANADATAKKQREASEESALKKAMEKPDSPGAIALVIGHYMAKQSEAFANAIKAAEVEPVIEGWDDKLLRFGLGTINALAPVAGNVILGLDAGKTNRRSSDNALAAQVADSRARVDSLAVVGNNSAAIARGGFEALLGASQRPTSVINVTGDHNAVASLSSTATASKNCTTGGTAPGGNGGTSGASGNGGNGATGSASGGSAIGGSGAPSGNTAPTGSGGQSGPTGSNGC